MEKLKIFISGTQDDMKPEREAVNRAVNATTLASGIRAETAFSQPQSPRAWIIQQIRECNIYLGVYCHRYGWIIPDENVSATEFEFNLARQFQKPILIWIRNLFDVEKAKPDFDRQEQFLNRVSDFSVGHLRQTFNNTTDLEKWVTAALGETFTEIIQRGTIQTSNKFLVPFPHNPDFVGRENDLATLHEMLQQSNSPVGIRPMVLVGLGGIGKTQLAVEYAHKYRADYSDGVFWLNAFNPLLFEFADVADEMSLADIEMSRNQAARKAWEYLDSHPNSLVIFDNVVDPAILNTPFVPGLIPANLRCHTLFTTRQRDFPRNFKPFEVRVLQMDASMRLLLRHDTRRSILYPDHPEHGYARIICITLGYLPLALELAAAFLGEYPDISLRDYRKRLLDEGALETVDDTHLRLEDMPTHHEIAVKATLQTSWKKVTDENARRAFLAAGQLREAEMIPVPRLGLLAGLDSEAKTGHSAPLARALKTLRRISLIEELTSDRLRLHPLVKEFAAGASPVSFRTDMAARVAGAFGDVLTLKIHIIRRGIGEVLEDLRTGIWLCTRNGSSDQIHTQLSTLERVLDREAHNLYNWDPNKHPGFFLQQFRNRCYELNLSDLQSQAEVQLAKSRLSHLRELFRTSHESEILIRTLEGHRAPVVGVAVTPDSRFAISVAHDRTLKVWDLANGQTIRTLLRQDKEATGVAVTPDGHSAISVSSMGDIEVWDLKSGQAIRKLEGRAGFRCSVAVTPDGCSVISGSDDTIKIWDLANGRVVRTLKDYLGRATGVAITPDGSLVISISKDNTLKVWNLASGKVVHTLEGHTMPVQEVTVTPDSRFVISASDDNTLKIWDLINGKLVRTLEGHTGYVHSIAVTSDGHFVVSASGDNTLKVWDLISGQAIRTLEGYTTYARGVAVTPDGHFAISSSKGHTLKVWDISTVLNAKLTSNQVSSTSQGHFNTVNDVKVTSDGRLAISASSDKTVKVWDLAKGQVIHTLKGHIKRVNSIANIGPEGNLAISASSDRTLKIWDLTSGQLIRTLKDQVGAMCSIAVTPDGRFAVSISYDRTLKVWDLTSGEAVRTLKDRTLSVNCVAVTPDGRFFVSASIDHRLKIWDLTTGEEIRTLKGHTHSVNRIVVTPNGHFIISASGDHTLKVWDLMNGQIVCTLTGHTKAVQDMAVTPDGQYVISIADDYTLRIWSMATGMTVLSQLVNTLQLCCAVAHDGRTIIIGDEAGAVHFLKWVKYPRY